MNTLARLKWNFLGVIGRSTKVPINHKTKVEYIPVQHDISSNDVDFLKELGQLRIEWDGKYPIFRRGT